MKKRLISIVLLILMIASVLPTATFAQGISSIKPTSISISQKSPVSFLDIISHIQDKVENIYKGISSEYSKYLSEKISISVSPSNCVDPNEELTLTVNVGLPGYYTYQWYSSSGENNKDGTLLSNQTSNIYKPDTSEPGISYYYCVVNGISPSSVTKVTVGKQVQQVSNVRLEFRNNALYVAYDTPECTEGILQYRIIMTDGSGNSFDTIGAGPDGASINGLNYILKDGTYSLSVYSDAVGSPWFDSTPVSCNGKVNFKTENVESSAKFYVYSVYNSYADENYYFIQTTGAGAYGLSLNGNVGNIYCQQAIDEPYQVKQIPMNNAFMRNKYTSFEIKPSITTQDSNNSYTVTSYNSINGTIETKQEGELISLSPTNVSVNTPVVLSAMEYCSNNGGYQWYACKSFRDNGTLIQGATKSTFVPPTDEPNSTYYYCTVGGQYRTQAIKVAVGTPVQPVTNVRLEMNDGALYVKYNAPKDTTGILQYRIIMTDDNEIKYNMTGASECGAIISERCGSLKDGNYSVSVLSQSTGIPWIDSEEVSCCSTVTVKTIDEQTPYASVISSYNNEINQYKYSVTFSENGIYDLTLDNGYGPFIVKAGETLDFYTNSPVYSFTINKIAFEELANNSYRMNVCKAYSKEIP